uniref:Uncharacterized protein n=1 Tax=viral metagenome TaxID=1070528 RepID=A0A6M3J487_9ZZZZ
MPEPYELYKKQGSVTASKEADNIPIEIGMMGFSLEDIDQGKKGMCVMPLGVRDSTKWGGRKWVRIKLGAAEAMRANRDIIIANEQGEAKEHTPVELSYQSVDGPYQRVTELFPLPITGTSRGITWTTSVLIVAAGNTELIPARAGYKIRVHGFCFSTKHPTSVDVALRSGDGGELKFRHVVAGDGGNVDMNLIDMCWECGTSKALNYYPQAAYATGVLVSVGYTLVSVG